MKRDAIFAIILGVSFGLVTTATRVSAEPAPAKGDKKANLLDEPDDAAVDDEAAADEEELDEPADAAPDAAKSAEAERLEAEARQKHSSAIRTDELPGQVDGSVTDEEAELEDEAPPAGPPQGVAADEKAPDAKGQAEPKKSATPTKEESALFGSASAGARGASPIDEVLEEIPPSEAAAADAAEVPVAAVGDHSKKGTTRAGNAKDVTELKKVAAREAAPVEPEVQSKATVKESLKKPAAAPVPKKTVKVEKAKRAEKVATKESGPKGGKPSQKAAPKQPVIRAIAKNEMKIERGKNGSKVVIGHVAPVSARAALDPSQAYLDVVRRQGETEPLSDFELGRYQYCGDDRDCVVAVNGCCDCANGGQDVAVNKDRLDAFRARFSCLYVSCGEKEAVPSCGSGVVSCINHECKYLNDNLLNDSF